MLTWKHSFAVFAPRFIAFVNAAVYLQRSQTSVLFFFSSLISSRSPVLISRFNSSIFWAPRLPAVTTLIIDPLQKEGQIKKEKKKKKAWSLPGSWVVISVKRVTAFLPGLHVEFHRTLRQDVYCGDVGWSVTNQWRLLIITGVWHIQKDCRYASMLNIGANKTYFGMLV